MRLSSPQMNIITRACSKASRSLIRDFGEIEKLQVSKKGPTDFVTNSDLKAEKIILEELIKAVQALNATFEVSKPILLKIAPDLNTTQLDEIIDLVEETKIEGVIASNTSISRANLKTDHTTLVAIGNGGVSGLPIKDKSTQVIKYLSEKSQNAFPIIGVGGIHSAQDAIEKIKAGADLVQIYTGFIYEGPNLVKRINKALLKSTLKS